MLAIDETHSARCFAVVLVTKRDSIVRFCVYYRRLKHVTEWDMYLQPRIDEMVGNVSSAAHSSTISMDAG